MGPMDFRGAPIPDHRDHCVRVRIQMGLVLLLLMGLVGPSCQRASVSREFGAHTLFQARFSSKRAWQHLEALVAIGPRVTGSQGVDRARSYIEGELRKLHLRVETHTGYIPIPPDGKMGLLVKNLIAVVPGASEDLVVLAAPFDTRLSESDSFMGANEGASGAAVLLELARVLGENPLPHTTASFLLSVLAATRLRADGHETWCRIDRGVLFSSRSSCYFPRCPLRAILQCNAHGRQFIPDTVGLGEVLGHASL